MKNVNVLAMAPEVARTYGKLRAELKRTGNELGPKDLFIAAHAIYLGATLVTDDDRAFSRVRGLKIENWLRQ